jgi:protein involved in polysaccharide export with SLBB domain
MLAMSILLSNISTAAVTLSQDVNEQKTSLMQPLNTAKIYGSWLFQGNFSNTSFSGLNPDYHIALGDKVLVQLWGGINFQGELVVDAHGNVFIPKVGPVLVNGVKNSELNNVIRKSVKRIYKANVEVYANLATSQKVKVFVAGTVEQPGLYEGQSADSILRFIDQAGGIRADIGGYRHIQLKRNNQLLKKFDLYDFLTTGELPLLPLQEGDVIFVGAKSGEITIEGDVGFAGKFEVKQTSTLLIDILTAVAIKENATHVTVVDSQGTEGDAKQYAINDLVNARVTPGSFIKVSSQIRAKSISVEVIGEHNSKQEFVIPWGATLSELITQIEFTSLSNKAAIQLYRPSVALRQKAMLLESLNSLEQNVLTTRSKTIEAANLRNTEAETILAWIEKAKKIEPKGQVLLTHLNKKNPIYLQQGDKIVIPAHRNLVMVHGEVLFPTAIAYQEDLSPIDFIEQAGGAMTDLDKTNILIMKPNGSVITANNDINSKNIITAGDEIFVLAKPDEKSFQLTKDITEVMYRIAASAAVFLAI